MGITICIVYCFHSSFVQIDRGHVFESDTDTEVIPKLLKYLYFTQVCLVMMRSDIRSEEATTNNSFND